MDAAINAKDRAKCALDLRSFVRVLRRNVSCVCFKCASPLLWHCQKLRLAQFLHHLPQSISREFGRATKINDFLLSALQVSGNFRNLRCD